MAHTQLAPARTTNGHAAELQAFSVPARHNPRLQALVDRVNADEELRQLWRCANVNAVDRLGQGDSGEIHARIVANAALKLLRLLRDAGEAPSVTDHHRLPPDEAEVIVVLAAALHDLGLATHPEAPQSAGIALATLKARELLDGLYSVRDRTSLLSEVLQAISSLPPSVACLTLEASLLRLADALDMTKGRVRLASGQGAAALVDEVVIQKHRTPPVRVLISLADAAAVGQVEALLQARLSGARLAGRVELLARLPGAGEPVLRPLHAGA